MIKHTMVRAMRMIINGFDQWLYPYSPRRFDNTILTFAVSSTLRQKQYDI